MNATFPCPRCDGDGRMIELASGRGGNDPWSTYRDVGACEACQGSGNARCEMCDDADATETWHERNRKYLVCHACWDEAAELAAEVASAERQFLQRAAE